MIIDSARTKAYAAVNVALVERNWLLGKRIAEEELQGEERAAYGASVIRNCQKNLLKSMERASTKLVFIGLYASTKASRRFLTQCVKICSSSVLVSFQNIVAGRRFICTRLVYAGIYKSDLECTHSSKKYFVPILL